MVDYLCLKLSRLTDEILDLPYFDFSRKFRTYTALDKLEQVLPITAIPLLSEEGGKDASDRVAAAQATISVILGNDSDDGPVAGVPEADAEVMKKFLEHEIGGELIDIQELIKGNN